MMGLAVITNASERGENGRKSILVGAPKIPLETQHSAMVTTLLNSNLYFSFAQRSVRFFERARVEVSYPGNLGLIQCSFVML